MDYLALYAEFLKKFLKPRRRLKVVFDCSNGTTGIILKKLFKANQLINQRPDGRFPAHGPDPMKKGTLGDLQKTVRRRRADLGVIFDADGDRVFFVDDRGRAVPPDAAAALISQNFHGPVILDVRAGYLARELMTKSGRKIIDSRVGHYFIKKAMAARKIAFAAEASGHYYFKLLGSYWDSGILAAIHFINSASRLKPELSDWLDSLPRYYHSGEINFAIRRLADKNKIISRVEKHYQKSAVKISHLDGLKMEFGNWWFSLRPSQTENLLRLNLEAKNKAVFKRELAGLTKPPIYAILSSSFERRQYVPGPH